MSRKIQEKTIYLSDETTTPAEEPVLSRKNRRAQQEPKTETSQIETKPKNTKKNKKRKLIANLLSLISIVLFIGGGVIIGKILYDEYIRSNATSEMLHNATKSIDDTIPREAFQPVQGDVVGIIEFPDYNKLQVPLVEGQSDADLYAGIGHDMTTGWPGDKRQIFLAGHRNTEFGVLKNVKVGDTILMRMPYGTYRYKIIAPPADGIPGELNYAGKIVKATQIDVINPTGEFPNDQLVLMTCYPFTFGADLEFRFLIYAELVQD